MTKVATSVSNLIENQFPAFFREEGPQFINFMKSYYEWLESEGQALYHSRRLLDYRDIDTTIDDFLVHFKAKYMNNIQLNTAVDTRKVIKNSLDMYRSKGTERSLDLFFRNIFGVSADIYYPGDDIFKTSDGKWIVPRYIEVEPSENNKNFIGLQIEGLESGATAFVEKFLIKKHQGSSRYSFIYYINKPKGNFLRGEKIKSSKTGEIGPVVLGSLNELNVISSSSGYEVGDIVDIYSVNDGVDGKARVSEVLSTSGKISFSLDFGGWGYNSNSEILISEKVINLSNVVYSNSSFELFERIYQPTSNIEYINLSANISTGDVITIIDDDTSETYAIGKILSIDESSNTAGTIKVSILSGHMRQMGSLSDEDGNELIMENGDIFTLDGISVGNTSIEFSSNTSQVSALDLYIIEEGNTSFALSNVTATANISTWTDVSPTGNLIGYSSNVNIEVITQSIAKFANGDSVYQLSGGIEIANGYAITVSQSGSNSSIRLIDTSGRFVIGSPIYSRETSAVGNVVNQSFSIGLIDVDGDFNSDTNNIIKSQSTLSSSTATRISFGTGANFVLSNTFSYVEEIQINTDKIEGYVSVELDSADYGFPAVGAEDQNTILEDALSYSTSNVGRITAIIVKNEGEDYDTSPFILIYNKEIANQNKKNQIIQISNTNGQYAIGEVIVQDGIEKGIISSDSLEDTLYIERISFSDINTSNTISGTMSGFTASVDYVNIDEDSDPAGINAVIIANTAAGIGVVSKLDIIDSGFNYRDFETVSFAKNGTNEGLAEARLMYQGFSEGYHKENNSSTSADKYLQDGQYYQEYSYEINSPLPLEKYSDILKKVIHMAGTKYFGKYVLNSINDISTIIESSMETSVISQGNYMDFSEGDNSQYIPLIT